MNRSMSVPLLLPVPLVNEPLGLTPMRTLPAHSWIAGCSVFCTPRTGASRALQEDAQPDGTGQRHAGSIQESHILRLPPRLRQIVKTHLSVRLKVIDRQGGFTAYSEAAG